MPRSAAGANPAARSAACYCGLPYRSHRLRVTPIAQTVVPAPGAGTVG